MNKEAYYFLLERRSVLIQHLVEPGPERDEIDKIMQVALRVPDHKVQAPWRFIVFDGAARESFGAEICKAYLTRESRPNADQEEIERTRFMRAPVVIAAITSFKEKPGVPRSEQVLSTGAACQNLINAVAAIGYASQWVTEWTAYDDNIKKSMGLTAEEEIAGFVYIGTPNVTPKSRRRPEVGDVVRYWGSDNAGSAP